MLENRGLNGAINKTVRLGLADSRPPLVSRLFRAFPLPVAPFPLGACILLLLDDYRPAVTWVTHNNAVHLPSLKLKIYINIYNSRQMLYWKDKSFYALGWDSEGYLMTSL